MPQNRGGGTQSNQWDLLHLARHGIVRQHEGEGEGGDEGGPCSECGQPWRYGARKCFQEVFKWLCTQLHLQPEAKREQFGEILLGLFTLVKVINSQKRKVDVDKVRKLGQQVYLQLVQLFPWVVVTPSVHRILAHSWEVVLLNHSFGLGSQSEEGLEAIINSFYKISKISQFFTKIDQTWTKLTKQEQTKQGEGELSTVDF